MHSLLVVLLVSVGMLVLLRAAIRIKSPFWSRQPVFHPYNVFLWAGEPGIIQENAPPLAPPVDLIRTLTREASDLTEEDREMVTEHLQDHYLRSKVADYVPTVEHVFSYLVPQSHAPIVCLVRPPGGALECSITARPLSVRMAQARREQLEVYYVDNLCARPDKRRTGVAEKAISTLYYELRRRNPSIRACLFKREGASMWIRPVVRYSTVGLLVKHLASQPGTWAPPSPAGEADASRIWSAISERLDTLDLSARIDPGLFAHLVRTGQLLVYELRSNIYVYRRACCSYPEGRAVECIFASVAKGPHADPLGSFCASAVSAGRDDGAHIILLEATGDSRAIADRLANTSVPFLFSSPTSFFLYNHSAREVEASNCGLLY